MYVTLFVILCNANVLILHPKRTPKLQKNDRNEIEAAIRKLIRLNYLPSQFGVFEELCRKADTALIRAVLNDLILGINLRPHNKPMTGVSLVA